MVEQLFTATGEEKGNGQVRREQLFPRRRQRRRRRLEAVGKREKGNNKS
jgi:hypothetical protein